MKAQRSFVRIRTWLLCLVPYLVIACTKAQTAPENSPTVGDAPTATLATVAVVLSPTSTATALAATATPSVSLTLEEPATPTPTPDPTTTPTHTPEPTTTPTHTREPTATPTATPTFASLALDPEQVPDEIRLDVVEQIGGHALAVTFGQGRIYLGLGPRLVVLDVPSASTGPQRLGQSDVLAGLVQDIHLVDHLAYVAAGKAGLMVVDVADPSNIRAIGMASIQEDAQALVVEPEDGLAYVAGGGPPGPGQGGALSVVDVSQPEAPRQVAFVELPGPAYDVLLAGRYAYILYEGGLLVVDVSDSASPIEVANVDVPQGARALAFADGYVYAAGYGLDVFDVSDPAQPRLVSRLESRLNVGAMAVQGKLAYLVDTFCEMGYCGSTVYIRDLSDPSESSEVGTWFTQSAVEDAVVYEDILYLASWQRGLQAIDVSDPAAPLLLGEYATLAAVEDVAVVDGFGYVSDEAQSGLQVLDLGGLPQVRVRGTAASTRWAGGYAIVDGYAYVPVWDDGFRIVDVRDPDSPQDVAAVDLGMAAQAVVVGERAYLTIGYEGLVVIDVAEPALPRVLGNLPLEGLAEGLAVAGERAYVTVDGGDSSTLYVIDIADPSRLGEMGQMRLQGKGRNVALDQEAGYGYVAIANCAYHRCSGGLEVVDLRDPHLPRTAAWVEVPGGVLDVALTGEYAFVAAGTGGVWVLDVLDPANPRAAGWRETAGRARSIVVAGERVYVADSQGGLLVLWPKG